MGLDLNNALISDTFDGLIKTQDGNVLTSSPLIVTDGRGNNSSLALATAGNGVIITGALTVDDVNILQTLTVAEFDITSIKAKTDFITVTGAVNLDTIKTKADFITVTQAVDLDTVESDILSAKTKTDFITVTQPVDLDTIESGLATAQGDITAIETKTDFITITQAVDLDTVEANAAAAKAKTDFITITQAVNLDTLESDLNAAKADITAIELKTDFITVTQAVDLDTIEIDVAASKAKTDLITITQAVDLDTVESDLNQAKTDIDNIELKTDFITVTQDVNLDTIESDLEQAKTDINNIELKTDFISVTQAVDLDQMEADIALNNDKNSYPTEDATKVGFITVTQAVNLDTMESDIADLSTNKYDKTGGTISGNVTVTGDLTVNGTTTTVNTETLSVKDPLIELASQNVENTVDTGFYANYSLNDGITLKFAGLFRDASDSDRFKLFKDLEVEPGTTVDVNGAGYTKGDLVVGGLIADTISGVLVDGVTATTQSAGDNSTKVATTAYVDSVVTAQDLDLAGDSGTASIDLNTQVLNIVGTTNEIETSAVNQTITIGLPSSVTVGTLNATNLGGTLTTAAQPNITSVGTLSSLTVAGALNGTISTATQPNITSLGTLSSLAVTGNLTVDNNTLFVDAANNRVGVGTSSPAVPLHTVGESLFEGGLQISSATPEILFAVPSGGLDSRIHNDGSGNFIFGTGTNSATPTERMRIDSSGTTTMIKSSAGSSTTPLVVRNSGSSVVNTESRLYLSTVAGDNRGCYIASKILNTNNENALILATNSVGADATEKVRIDPFGNVGINQSNPNDISSGATTLHITGTVSTKAGAIRLDSSDASITSYLYPDTTNGLTIATSTNHNMRFITNGGERMRILNNGNINLNSVVYGNTVGSPSRTLYIDSIGGIGGISSIRASKTNIKDINDINWIYDLNPVEFNYRKIDEEGNYTDEFCEDKTFGLIAEDTEPIADFLINYNEVENGEKEMKGIEYSRLITPMLKAIQELKAEIETLKAQING